MHRTKDSKTITKKYYDIHAASWDEQFLQPLVKLCESSFKKYSSLLPSGKVIDLGCGTGRDSALFTSNGYEYIGIDLSEGMLMKAQHSFPNTAFKEMDLINLKFSDETFDGCWSFAAYLHIPKKDINKALKESCRILKPGGVGYFVVKKGSGERYIGEGDNRRYWAFYGKNQFLKLLVNAGFEAISITEDKPGEHSVFLGYYVKKVVHPLNNTV